MHFFLSPHTNNLSWIQFTEAVFKSVVILNVFVTVLEFIKSCFKHFDGTFWRYNFIFSCAYCGKSQMHNKVNYSHIYKQMHRLGFFISFKILQDIVIFFSIREDLIFYQIWKPIQVKFIRGQWLSIYMSDWILAFWLYVASNIGSISQFVKCFT